MSMGWQSGDFSPGGGWDQGVFRDNYFRMPRVPEGTTGRAARAAAWPLALLFPLIALLYHDRIYDEPYPQLDLGSLECLPTTGPTELMMVFDDSGSMGWNDPYNRRYEEARQLAGWWSEEGCDASDRIGVSHFDNALPPLAPGLVSSTDVIPALQAGSSSSAIAPPVSQALGWAAERPTRDIILLFSDGQNGDIADALAQLRAQQGPEVIFVSLGNDLPADWNDPVIDGMVPVGVRPTLGSVGVGTAQQIKEAMEQ